MRLICIQGRNIGIVTTTCMLKNLFILHCQLFQSRFGKQEWVKPYTDQLLQQWGEQNVQSVQVISPAFSADCLETLEELAMQNKEIFQHAGGGDYAYIPALNADQAHIDLLASLVQANLDALTHTLAHR